MKKLKIPRFAERNPDIEASVYLLSTEEGGRRSCAWSGWRPHHLVKSNYQTTGLHKFIGQEVLDPGASCDTEIWFLSPESYQSCLWLGKILEIREGARLVGRATVTKIYNTILEGDQERKEN
jgi:translation elongation factor EF-Tu-like GTPase